MCTHSLVTLVVSRVLSLVHACTIYLLGRLKFPPDNYIVDRLKDIHMGLEALGQVSSMACKLGPEGVVSIRRAGSSSSGLSGRGVANRGT
jgi:hypothetical protein